MNKEIAFPDKLEHIKLQLKEKPRRWLVSGVAGFIGSHLLKQLLELKQEVVGIDNFSTGKPENLEQVKRELSKEDFSGFTFREGDICDFDLCGELLENVDTVLHQAALGSVPRSIKEPEATHRANVDGFFNLLLAACRQKVRNFVYASSSSVYGDIADSPKKEERIGEVLSPYAASKRIGEIYAGVFSEFNTTNIIGLRYFNVFGPRQDPNGEYAAVIPRWIKALIKGAPCIVYGDGKQSRDFCYIENVVNANLLAAFADKDISGEVFNVALGGEISLLDLYELLRAQFPEAQSVPAMEFLDARPGDVRNSRADISKAQKLLGYRPAVKVESGIARTVDWFKAGQR